MKLISKCLSLTFVFATVTTFNACSSPKAENKNVVSENSALQKTEVKSQSNQSKQSATEKELEAAKKAGKSVFLVVTGNKITETGKATSIAKQASGKVKNSLVAQLNRDDVANAELVAKYRLDGAPLPLILVISPKGYATGGLLLADASVEKLAKLVPSPKMDEVYEALNGGKSVLIVVSKKSNMDKSKVVANCKLAVSQLNDNARLIEVDRDDAKEADFIKQLNMNNVTNKSSIMVLNKAGQTTGVFEGVTEPAVLKTAATKVIRGGCGSSCSPGGC